MNEKTITVLSVAEIRKRLMNKNLSYISRECDLSKMTLSHIRSGAITNCKIDTMVKLTAALME